METIVRQGITFYQNGPQAGFEAFFETCAGSYFIDSSGVVHNVDGEPLNTSEVAKDSDNQQSVAEMTSDGPASHTTGQQKDLL